MSTCGGFSGGGGPRPAGGRESERAWMCNLGKNTDFDFMSPICRLYGQVELRSTHLSLEILDFIESVLVAAEKFDHSEGPSIQRGVSSASSSDLNMMRYSE